jgi:uncharacterized protein with ATP-grasp and redox domains
MTVSDECCDCLLSRVAHTCSLVGRSVDASAVTATCSARLTSLRELPVPLPVIASDLHRLTARMLEISDPYAEVKRASNEIVRSACSKILPRLKTFRDLAIAAIIGNTFDHGVKGHEITSDFPAFFTREFERGLAVDDCDRIEQLLGRVVYITDNCGEIVLDRLLIEHLVERGCEVTVAVRDAPVLNDATLAEAHAFGIDRLRLTLTTTGGGSEIGVPFDRIPHELAEAFDRADLIIAKGMANYESISEYDGLPPVAHLLAAKCAPIASRLGVRVGEKVALLRQ